MQRVNTAEVFLCDDGWLPRSYADKNFLAEFDINIYMVYTVNVDYKGFPCVANMFLNLAVDRILPHRDGAPRVPCGVRCVYFGGVSNHESHGLYLYSIIYDMDKLKT